MRMANGMRSSEIRVARVARDWPGIWWANQERGLGIGWVKKW